MMWHNHHRVITTLFCKKIKIKNQSRWRTSLINDCITSTKRIIKIELGGKYWLLV